jgi:hypothetical protein
VLAYPAEDDRSHIKVSADLLHELTRNRNPIPKFLERVLNIEAFTL